ncbi:aminodeoxychorismate synthase component I [Halochromatium glycolicum]|nr:aminodeoxychorismate synthase component I [Halochromatium glycolicum]
MRYLTELPYLADSAQLFASLADRPWAMFLDSAATSGGDGRWDILAADPTATLVTRGRSTAIRDAQGTRWSEADPFALLREALGPRTEAPAGLPFAGGAIGWFGYDLARRIERLPLQATDAEDLPEMAIGIFDWALLVDHLERRSWLVGAGRSARTCARWPQLVEHFSRLLQDLTPALATIHESSPDSGAAGRARYREQVGREPPDETVAGSDRSGIEAANIGPACGRARPSAEVTDSASTARAVGTALRATAPLHSNLSFDAYAAAFRRVQDYIQAGDCYQVNLAQRFAAPANGDPWPAYCCLRQLNPAPFSAYLKTPFGEVLSSSPERFLALRGGRVETRPIKGTRPRSSDAAEDAALRRALAESPKDRAENLMIVDLLRNDLGRVCQPGSIQVPALFATETYASVHHLVSTVCGELRAGEDAASLLRACFPGGSITGAPKIRAMEIIEELEPHRRGIYCGAIGYLGFDGAMDTNIAIRTIVNSGGQARFWSGGGLVHDSVLDEEYRETFDKAARLMQLLAPTSPPTPPPG